jgi:hypothetical protein
VFSFLPSLKLNSKISWSLLPNGALHETVIVQMLHCLEVGNIHPMLPLQDHKRSDHLRDQGQPKNSKCPVRTVPLNAIVKPSFDPNYLHLSQLQKVRSHASIYDLVHLVPTELISPFASNFRTPPTSLIKATGFAIIPVARCNVYA